MVMHCIGYRGIAAFLPKVIHAPPTHVRNGYEEKPSAGGDLVREEQRAGTERARIAPRLWVLSLLWRHNTTLDTLNRQLLQEPNGRPFVPGVHPEPMPSRIPVEDTFGRHLELGTTPDGRYYGGDDGRFNLAERVRQHDPDSYPWLLSDLLPYFKAELPPVDHAVDTLAATLAALGLRRISWITAAYAAQILGDKYWSLIKRQLDFYATLPSPLHLTLLACLWHERRWCASLPDGTTVRTQRYLDLLSGAWDLAINSLSCHPMLATPHSDESLKSNIECALEHVRHNITWFAARSASSRRYPIADLDPPIFVRDFDGFNEANGHGGLHVRLPLSIQIPTAGCPKSPGAPIRPEESNEEHDGLRAKFAALLAHFDAPELPRDRR